MKMKLVIFLAVLALASYLAVDGSTAGIGLASIKGYIQSFGFCAPLVYILIFALVLLTIIPNSLLAISGGALFGIYYGTLYTVIGALSGATLAFAISRYLGKSIAEKLIKQKADWLNEHAEKNGFMIVFLLRLIPLIPFDAISYGAGLSKIRYMDFLGATCIGILPGVLVYSNIGDKSLDIYSADFYLSLAILALLVAVSHYAKKRYTLKEVQKASITS